MLAELSKRLKRHVRSSGLYVPLRRLRLAVSRDASGPYPDWAAILGTDLPRWQQAVRDASGPRVLIATNTGMHTAAAAIDSMLAVALTLRGARVELVRCDGALPACMMADHTYFPNAARFAKTGPQAHLCRACQFPSQKMFGALGLPVHRLSQAASAVPTATDAATAEQAMAGALRFFARESLQGEPHGTDVLARYEAAAEMSLRAARRIFAQQKYDAAVIHHGIYVPQGPFAQAAREAGVRVATWHTAYRAGSCIFSHDDTYHRTMLDEPVETWEHLQLSPAQREDILAYLHSRRRGTQDWISFQRGNRQDYDALAAELGIDPRKPLVGLFTSVGWDARLHYHGSAYASQEEWLLDTIRFFAAKPELQLAVRVHPAELLGSPPSRQRLAGVIAAHFPQMPPNIFVLGPQHTANSYALAEQCDSALIYSTKMGIELASLGLPVIVAGEAWIRGKGFSHDAASAAEYRKLLEQLPFRQRLDDATRERAIRYAYHFFARRMIPLSTVDPASRWPLCRLRAKNLAAFEPGMDKGLDVICAGILEQKPFIFRVEKRNT